MSGHQQAPAVFLSAGEPSGDIHGSALIAALRERLPGARFLGLGGPRMKAQGMQLLADPEDLAVMGFAEVARRLPFFLRLRRRMRRTLEEQRVDLVIPIDYPGFNMRLARDAKQLGLPVLFYIAPQVWAWHASRAAKLAKYTDCVAVVLPFEAPFLREAGADAVYVGHPLATEPLQGRGAHPIPPGINPDWPVLALLPGSRPQEIERHLKLFSAAAALVKQQAPHLQPVIARAADLAPSLFAATPWPTVDGADTLLGYADAAIVKSGTSTLQAALAGVPFIVAYRMHPLTHAIAKRVVRVPHIALANLVLDKRAVPEFVQEDATPASLAAAVLPLLSDGPARGAMLADLRSLRALLGEEKAAERVADIALGLLGSGAASARG